MRLRAVPSLFKLLLTTPTRAAQVMQVVMVRVRQIPVTVQPLPLDRLALEWQWILGQAEHPN